MLHHSFVSQDKCVALFLMVLYFHRLEDMITFLKKISFSSYPHKIDNILHRHTSKMHTASFFFSLQIEVDKL